MIPCYISSLITASFQFNANRFRFAHDYRVSVGTGGRQKKKKKKERVRRLSNHFTVVEVFCSIRSCFLPLVSKSDLFFAAPKLLIAADHARN